MSTEETLIDVQEDVVDESLEASEHEKSVEANSETVDKTEETVESQKDAEIRMLRQMSREQKQRIEALENAVTGTHEKLRQANLITQEDEEEAAARNVAYTQRVEQLNHLLEVMSVNPKYEDIDKVVTQAHFDDMVEIMAIELEKQGNGTVTEISKQLTREIWNLPNPYKYMYDLIKKSHPDYVKTAAGTQKTREPAKAATSIVDVPGGSSTTSVGWTAKMIDSLPEEKLHTVPAEVYAKYMRNELQ